MIVKHVEENVKGKMMIIGNYNGRYIGKAMCGFKYMHDYSLNVDRDEYGYQVSGIIDLTEEVQSNAYITYASENSLLRNWIINRGDTIINNIEETLHNNEKNGG